MISWRKFISVEWMLLCIWIVAFAIYEIQPYTDPDTPWHLATGAYILKHHMVPTHDPFSWTMKGKPWVTQEWLFETVLAWLGQHLGYAGTWLLQVVLNTVTVLVLYRLGLRVTRGNGVVAALTAVSGTLVGLMFWTMRPQMVSYMMFAVFLLILQRVREGRFRTLLWVPPLMLIWANAHGSSIIGPLMLVLELLISFVPTLGRLQRLQLPKGARIRLLIAAVTGLLAGLVNPNGIKAYTYALLSTDSVMTNNIMEWHSPNFHGQAYQYGILPFLIVAFFILLARSKTVPMRELLYFGGSFAATLIHQRFLPYLAIVSAPLLAVMLGDWFRRLLRPSRWMLVFDSVLMLGTLFYFGTQIPSVRGSVESHMSSSAYPVAAVTYLKKHNLTDHLLNAYHWGGYLIYRGVPTFVDGRTDIFLQGSVFSDYLAIKNVWWNGPSLIKSYHFKAALFPSGYPVVSYLSHDPNWHVAFQDDNAEILVRNDSKQK